MDVRFLALDEVLAVHRDQIDRYGGALGIRDISLLISALAVPRATFGGEYVHSDLFEMAAAYLFHIVKNHPFLDGNKRTGLVAALVFLELNSIEIEAEEDDLAALVEGVARSEVDKAAVAAFLKICAQ